MVVRRAGKRAHTYVRTYLVVCNCHARSAFWLFCFCRTLRPALTVCRLATMAGVRGMKKGVRGVRRVHATMEQQLAKPMLRASGGRAAIGNSPGKRGMAASAKNLLKKVKGRARQPVQIVRNQICLTGGLLGSTHVCVPVNADGEGREWVQLKASLPWLVAATTGKGSIRRSGLKYVTLMAEVREQLRAAAGPEVAPEANALAPAGGGARAPPTTPSWPCYGSVGLKPPLQRRPRARARARGAGARRRWRARSK